MDLLQTTPPEERHQRLGHGRLGRIPASAADASICGCLLPWGFSVWQLHIHLLALTILSLWSYHQLMFFPSCPTQKSPNVLSWTALM